MSLSKKTNKKILKNNFKNTNSFYDTGVYKIYSLECNKLYWGKLLKPCLKEFMNTWIIFNPETHPTF